MADMTRHVVMSFLMLMAAESFLVDDTHDESLQVALNAIEQLNSRLQDVTSRLQASEAALKAYTEKLSTAQTSITSLQSRAFSDFIWYDDWVLVFRAAQGIEKSVYDTWTAAGRHDDDPITRLTLPCGCTSVNGSLPCDRHYRSRILDTWPSLSIDQVKLVVYDRGVEKAHVTFRGTGSTNMSWFSLDRVVESSWDDLTPAASVNYFSIDGHATSTMLRRFFINHEYNTCAGDSGWLVVVDRETDDCSWGTKGHFPSILYDPQRRVVTDESLIEADVMAVFVKFRQIADLGEVCMK
ncbi:uncharacterized protein LOC112567338 isoform X2 [Pomacea canaliculata]|uniref:uncharacterized protein LOC112567338 isoform X2 n=1 Tax=Pomacea canaliculata TaxID=400727 RepID=UPI000D73D603|nr:uncharacterized protein LOC112567338 isoform X2 [Pomacea canaliculata]